MIAILCGPLLLLFLARLFYLAVLRREDRSDHPDRNVQVQKYLRGAGIVILIGGVVAGGIVYATTPPQPEDDADVVDYNVVGGQVFAVKASESVSYQRKLLATGGNYDLLTDQVLRWIAARWRGRNLATTLVVLAGMGFLACFYFARWF
jgi:hypothetical protein